MRITGIGHALFAATFMALGVWGLVSGHFNTVWAGAPKSLPGREILAYVTALVSLACGAALLWRRTAAWAAALLTVLVLLWIAAFRVTPVVHAPLDAGIWDGFGIVVMIALTSWALFAEMADESVPPRLRFATGASGVRIIHVIYGLVLVDFGIAHFGYLTFTASLVPSYLPDHVAWAEATGVAYMAAGLAILTGVWARLAAALVIVQIAGFTLLVWAPIMAKGSPSAGDLSESVMSWLLTACAVVLYETWRGAPWLAAPRLGQPQPA
jgi:uncharacterized membrane protein